MLIMGSDGEWGTEVSDCSQICSMKRLFDAKTEKKKINITRGMPAYSLVDLIGSVIYIYICIYRARLLVWIMNYTRYKY